MSEVQALGSAHCATCKGRGILTDREGRPHQCRPCTPDRSADSLREHGFVAECRGCTAVLTAAELTAARDAIREGRVHGPLCRECLLAMVRERMSA